MCQVNFNSSANFYHNLIYHKHYQKCQKVQHLICLVGSMGTRVVMQEQHTFGSLPLNGLTKFPENITEGVGPLKHHLSAEHFPDDEAVEREVTASLREQP
jgi:hypothetical protein